MAAEESETSLLCVIYDAHPLQSVYKTRQQIMTQCLDSLIAFCNAHLMLKSKNKLAFLACHVKRTTFLYPPKSTINHSIRQHDGQYELFTLVEKCIKENLRELIQSEAEMLRNTGGSNVKLGDSLIAGAIAMALCYIHRLHRGLTAGEKMNARILIVSGSPDSASQYMNFMNVFFTSQKQNVIIDVCSLDQDMTLLQQGCDITGGLYLKTPSVSGLIQYLMWVFLPEPPIRTSLLLPPAVRVDYRAACFCHRELIDVGFVCSVCLSIFCKFSPICTTCHTVFQFPGPLPLIPKKKKKYA